MLAHSLWKVKWQVCSKQTGVLHENRKLCSMTIDSPTLQHGPPIINVGGWRYRRLEKAIAESSVGHQVLIPVVSRDEKRILVFILWFCSLLVVYVSSHPHPNAKGPLITLHLPLQHTHSPGGRETSGHQKFLCRSLLCFASLRLHLDKKALLNSIMPSHGRAFPGLGRGCLTALAYVRLTQN